MSTNLPTYPKRLTLKMLLLEKIFEILNLDFEKIQKSGNYTFSVMTDTCFMLKINLCSYAF